VNRKVGKIANVSVQFVIDLLIIPCTFKINVFVIFGYSFCNLLRMDASVEVKPRISLSKLITFAFCLFEITWITCPSEFLSSGPTHSSMITPRVKFLFRMAISCSRGRVLLGSHVGSATGHPPSCLMTRRRGSSLTSTMRADHN
jgi:hypothetical protein